MTHTPGPWIAGWSGDPDTEGLDAASPLNIVAVHRGGVAFCQPILSGHASTWPIVEANARLIAAAPDLLAACRGALVTETSTARQRREACRAAIAKAEGQPCGPSVHKLYI